MTTLTEYESNDCSFDFHYKQLYWINDYVQRKFSRHIKCFGFATTKMTLTDAFSVVKPLIVMHPGKDFV